MTDDPDSASRGNSIAAPALEFPSAMHGSTARNGWTYSASNLNRLSGVVFGKRLCSKRIELSGRGVGLDLGIPCRSVEFRKPAAKLGQFSGRKRGDRFLKRFQRSHLKTSNNHHNSTMRMVFLGPRAYETSGHAPL